MVSVTHEKSLLSSGTDSVRFTRTHTLHTGVSEWIWYCQTKIGQSVGDWISHPLASTQPRLDENARKLADTAQVLGVLYVDFIPEGVSFQSYSVQYSMLDSNRSQERKMTPLTEISVLL